MGGTTWQLADAAFFFNAELHSKVSGACVRPRVALRLRQMRPCFRTPLGLGGRPKAKGTGNALNARMLGTPLA